jgi:tetratricopeptide (TPR) repeat protein
MRQALVVVAFLFFSTGVALGAERDSARDHYVKGTRAYELGLYEEAIAEYTAAYKLKDDPALLFNIGQAHRLAGHPAEALRLYKTYLAKVPDAPNRADVEAKMTDLARQLEQQKQAAATPAPVPAPAPATSAPETGAGTGAPSAEASPPVAPANAAPALTPTTTTVAEATSAETGGQGMRLAGIATAAAGLALVGTGIVFGVLARQAADDLSELDRNRGVFDPAKEEAGERNQLLAGILIGTGAAAVATGVVLYVLGARDGRPASQAFVISPSVTPRAAGAAFRLVY